MTFKVTVAKQSYDFSGPYTQPDQLASKSGTYLVTTKKKSGAHKFLDVGESVDVKNRVENHDRADCWVRKKKNGLFYSGYYCDETARTKLADDIREAFDLPCGKR